MRVEKIPEKKVKEVLEYFKNTDFSISLGRRRRKLVITCPKCNRKGILKLVKKGRNYRFQIEHWILYGDDPAQLSARQRTEKCLITFHDEELFRKILNIYVERFDLSPNFRKWLEFYEIL